jgi:hypothetical protein
MGHAEEDCYLKKINAKKEQKNAEYPLLEAYTIRDYAEGNL